MRRCFAGGILGEVQVLAPCCCEGNNLETHGEVGVGRDLNDGMGRDISTPGCWFLCLLCVCCGAGSSLCALPAAIPAVSPAAVRPECTQAGCRGLCAHPAALHRVPEGRNLWVWQRLRHLRQQRAFLFLSRFSYSQKEVVHFIKVQPYVYPA